MHKILIFFLAFIAFDAWSQLNVDFSSNIDEICVGESVNFTDLSTSTTPIISWVWDFGDGSGSTNQNPTHTYNTPGTYTVILTAGNGANAISEVKTDFIIVHPLPNPSFTLSNPPCTLPASITVTSVSPNSGSTYAWNFGNGQTSTQQLPSGINYSSAGTFSVQLTVTNNATGCSNTVSQNVTISTYSTSFSASSQEVCVGEAISFTNTSTAGTNLYNWNFGNGNTSSAPNPTYAYGTAGTYNVTLNSQNTALGCSGQASIPITVVAAQVPSFTPSLTVGCNPSTVSFTNNSGFNGTFNWTFGNGSNFTGVNPPPQTYSIPPDLQSNSFTVVLNSTDANGCSSVQAFPNLITIFNVFAEFEIDVVEGCETLASTFTNGSFSPNSNFPITSWNWNFGNGQTSTAQNPPTQFYDEGVYDVSLTVTTANGCTATLDSISAIQVGIPPDILFTVDPDTICARETLIFDNLTTISVPHLPEEVEYSWMIGDQGPFPQFEPNDVPVLDTGLIDITLIVSFRGCNDTLVLEEEVFIFGPLVDFSTPGILCNPTVPVSVEITDNTILGQDNDNVSVFWSLGDGTNFSYIGNDAWDNNGESFDHTYLTYGNYQLKQKAINHTNGCEDSISQTIIINFFEVTAEVILDSVCFGEESEFGFSYESIPTGGILDFTYIASDSLLGSFVDFEVSLPDSFIYPEPGMNTIQVSAINQYGCPASAISDIYVAPPPEVIIELVSVLGCVPTEATFESNSISGSGVPFVNLLWTSQGNAISPNNQNSFTVEVENIGDLSTSLEITDALGCIGSATLISDFIEPEASFTIPDTVCNNLIFNPVNTSINYTNSQWFWNGNLFGEGDSPDLLIDYPPNPSSLSESGTLTLIASDGFGCQDEFELPLVVSTPNAAYTFSFIGANVDEDGNFTCPSVFAQFTDQSSSIGDIVSWSWTFGDGKSSVLQNPTNTYVFSGSYTSSLSITDEFGCSAEIVFEDFLEIGGPSGEFDWQQIGIACDQNYDFFVIDTNDVAQIQWFPGDGTWFSSLDGGAHGFSESGAFYPYVTITNEDDCAVTYYLDTIDIIFGNIQAEFSVNPILLNWGDEVEVINQSTGGIGGIVSNSWSFGSDSFINNNQQFDYLFDEAGELSIVLIVQDSLGCTDTAVVNVSVTALLAYPNVFSPNGDGDNEVFRFVYNAFREYEVVILNRWGNIMSSGTYVDQNYLWDGRLPNGELASEGVYFYYVKGILRDNTYREDHGFFHLVLD